MSRIKNLKLDATLVNIDYNAKDFTPSQILLPNISVSLVGVVDIDFLDKLVKFIEKETIINNKK